MDDAAVPRAALPRSRADEERIERYAESCPDSWAGFSIDGAHTVAWFTDADRHRAPVLALVDEPERFEVRSAPRSAAELAGVRSAVDDLLSGHRDSWYACGVGLHQVSISLAGHATDLAEHLHATFGDAVDIEIAGHHYPVDPAALRRRLPHPLETTIVIPGLELVTELEAGAVVSGQIAAGRVHLHNGSRETLSVEGNGARGVIIDAAGPLAVSGSAQWLSRRGVQLDPDGDAQIPFTVGTDSLDPALGPLVPPGDYQLIVGINIAIVERDRGSAMMARAAPRSGDIITSPIPIRVLPRPR